MGEGRNAAHEITENIKNAAVIPVAILN